MADEITKAMMRAQLGDGEDSDSEDGVAASKPILRCVQVLRNLQDQASDLKTAYRAERVALEQKYAALNQPIYDKRVPIISGEQAPVLTKEEEDGLPDDAPDSDQKGIPGFWLQALGQHQELQNWITEEDIPLLQCIKDIKVTYNDDYTSFTITFFFSQNDYMEETELSKVYTVTDLLDESEAPALTGNDGTDITWKAGMDLTVTEVKKKQKAKGGKNKGQTRTITKIEPKHSFFLWFGKPREVDEDEEDEEDEDDYDPKPGFDAEDDYEVGHAIRTTIVPEAVYWFTGENAKDDEDDEDYDDEDEDEEDDEDEEEEEEEEEESKPKGRRNRGNNKGGSNKGPALPPGSFNFDPNAPPPAPGANGEQQECKQT
jgi:nucleosome assembly protein 1-like 1